MKTIIKAASVGLIATFLAACNTAHGVGEDVEAGGEVIQDTADDVQDEMSE